MGKKKLKTRILMQIEDISDGKEEAFAATLPDYNNAVVMGRDMNEIMEGVKALIEYKTEKRKR
jgi:hypothetical protein